MENRNGLKKRILALLLLVCLIIPLTSNAEGLLPSLNETVGIAMPSLGEALQCYPSEEMANEDGSITEVFINISEEDFNAFSEYLEQQTAELADYKVVSGVLTAEIQAKGTSYYFNYNSRNGEARLTFPTGTYDEWVREAKTHFDSAQKLLTDGKADEAYDEISTIPQFLAYEPVVNLLKEDKTFAAAAASAVAEFEARIAPYTKVGGIVTFGMYPQTTEGTDQSPIEWIILDYDERNYKSLLLSKYGLDAKPFDNNKPGNWSNCTLRDWLNTDFLNKAFSTEEQNAILTTEVNNSKEQGYSGWDIASVKNTEDKVFLLSYKEANKYLNVTHNDTNNTKSRMTPTAYAISKDAQVTNSYKTADGEAAGWWWLRSPGMSEYYAAVISPNGSASKHSGVETGNGIVRPTIWLNLEWIKGEKATFDALKILLSSKPDIIAAVRQNTDDNTQKKELEDKQVQKEPETDHENADDKTQKEEPEGKQDDDIILPDISVSTDENNEPVFSGNEWKITREYSFANNTSRVVFYKHDKSEAQDIDMDFVFYDTSNNKGTVNMKSYSVAPGEEGVVILNGSRPVDHIEYSFTLSKSKYISCWKTAEVESSKKGRNVNICIKNHGENPIKAFVYAIVLFDDAGNVITAGSNSFVLDTGLQSGETYVHQYSSDVNFKSYELYFHCYTN